MIAVKAVYEDGALRFVEPPPAIERSPVIVIFLEAPSKDTAQVAADRSGPTEVESVDALSPADARLIRDAVVSYRVMKPTDHPDQAHQVIERLRSRQAERAKIALELAAYRVLHADLVKDHLGQYVAIHNGELVDHDTEFSELHQRIRQRFGRQAVLLHRVELEMERELVFRSPRLDG